MAEYDKIQDNGICWDCGCIKGEPVIGLNDSLAVVEIGWHCAVCGRWWPVYKQDLRNWITRYKAQDTANITKNRGRE